MRWLADKLLPGPYFVSRFPVSETDPGVLGTPPINLEDEKWWLKCENWNDATRAAHLQSAMHKDAAIIVGKTGQTWKLMAGFWDGGVHPGPDGKTVKHGAWRPIPEPSLERGILWRIKPIK